MSNSPSTPNIILMGIDSIRADHMSCYGYPRLTSPHLDRFALDGTLFENTISAHIPTTSAYASMLTGLDTFGTQVVALRHKGGLRPEIRTLAEILRGHNYDTTCVGFTGNPSARGFDRYLDYAGWGLWAEGRSPKAQNLNEVAIPELERLASNDRPFFLFLRHMDPHAPYLPPEPFERAFYHGNELDPANRSMDPVMAFKPFRDFFRLWMPPGITDKDYVIAQYDGAIAYMDACIANLFESIQALGLAEDTLVIVNGDHGETLYDHECWFDHHGIYDTVLHVPLIMRMPGRIPAGHRVAGFNQHKDLVPTILDYLDLEEPDTHFDGHSLRTLIEGQVASFETGIYLTECTWMRKHGWRTASHKVHSCPGTRLPFQAGNRTLRSGCGSRGKPQHCPGTAGTVCLDGTADAELDPATGSGNRLAQSHPEPGRMARGRRGLATSPPPSKPMTRCISVIPARLSGCRPGTPRPQTTAPNHLS